MDGSVTLSSVQKEQADGVTGQFVDSCPFSKEKLQGSKEDLKPLSVRPYDTRAGTLSKAMVTSPNWMLPRQNQAIFLGG